MSKEITTSIRPPGGSPASALPVAGSASSVSILSSAVPDSSFLSATDVFEEVDLAVLERFKSVAFAEAEDAAERDFARLIDLLFDNVDFKLERAQSTSASSTSVTSFDFDTLRLPLDSSPVGMASLVSPLGIDGSLSRDSAPGVFLDSDFSLGKLSDAIDVSPTIEPDFRLDSLVTSLFSLTKLLDFFDLNDGFEESRFVGFVFADIAPTCSSSSSKVKVDARRRAGSA